MKLARTEVDPRFQSGSAFTTLSKQFMNLHKSGSVETQSTGMVHDQSNILGFGTRESPLQKEEGATPPCKGGWGDFPTASTKCYLNPNGK